MSTDPSTEDGFPAAAYLARIGLDVQPAADLEGLRLVHRAHHRAIPFEDIDVFLGRLPDLSLPGLVGKLIHARRGGYCLESNRLLNHALTALGFEVRDLLGRVRLGGPPGARAHHALIVHLDGADWLADVGFGGPGPLGPLPVEPGRVHEQAGVRYRIMAEDGDGMALQRAAPGGDWSDLYGWRTDEQVLAVDFDTANVICTRSDLTPFPRHLMLSVHRADGRTTLMNRQLSIIGPQGDQTRRIADAVTLAEVLDTQFGIVLSADDLDALMARLLSGRAGPATG